MFDERPRSSARSDRDLEGPGGQREDERANRATFGTRAVAALRDASQDASRLVPANLVWALVAVALGSLIAASRVALILLPVLAIPTAGVFRVAAGIVRGEPAAFGDAFGAWRTGAMQSVALGAALLVAVEVPAVNIVAALASGSPLGLASATLAGWMLLAVWAYAWVVWPLLADPRRADQSVRYRLRLAGLLLLAHPVRLAILAAALALFLAVSAITVVPLVTVSVSLAALAAGRAVLPASDALERRVSARTRSDDVARAADVPGTDDLGSA